MHIGSHKIIIAFTTVIKNIMKLYILNFKDNRYEVSSCNEVEDMLMQYKSRFYSEEV